MNNSQFQLPVGLKVIGRVRVSLKPRPLSIADFRLLRTHVVLVYASVARGIIRGAAQNPGSIACCTACETSFRPCRKKRGIANFAIPRSSQWTFFYFYLFAVLRTNLLSVPFLFFIARAATSKSSRRALSFFIGALYVQIFYF